jgi:hypothetical protein
MLAEIRPRFGFVPLEVHSILPSVRRPSLFSSGGICGCISPTIQMHDVLNVNAASYRSRRKQPGSINTAVPTTNARGGI